MRLRTVLIIGILIALAFFVYLERAILTPFVFAAIFAYLFNPTVNFFDKKIKLPRSLSVILIFLVLISLFIAFIFFVGRALILESSEFRLSAASTILNARAEIDTLPPYVRPAFNEAIQSASSSDFLKASSIFTVFPRAVSGIIALLIFIVSSFYFLKDGKNIIEKLILFSPMKYKVELEILLRRINSVLGSYLRGQVFLIFIVSLILFIALSILGVKFALLISIFSGLAEIVPIIGPIVATVAAVIAVYLGGGSSNFPITPIQTSIIVIIIYFIVRQLQDYLITPHVMGRITKLHPFVVLFAVIAGGHLAGIMGLLLAVPVAAVLKILLEFGLDTLNDRDLAANKKPGR